MINENQFSILFENGDTKYYTWNYKKNNDSTFEIHLLDTNGFNERFKIFRIENEIYVELRGKVVDRNVTLLTNKLYNIAEKIILKDALKGKDEPLKVLSPLLHNLGHELKKKSPNDYVIIEDFLGLVIRFIFNDKNEITQIATLDNDNNVDFLIFNINEDSF